MRQRAREAGISTPSALTTPYLNTIPKHEEVPYPGDRKLEARLESLIRWNAMAMVHGQNKKDAGIGGHLSTYSSLATLLEVGFNHFFHATYGDQPGDFIYFQGHASPGIYARAYLEGRFDDQRLLNFRHELRGEPGLSSYPHPWLMPDFWRFPTVSMGIGPLNAIYQARFMRYLENRKPDREDSAQDLGVCRRWRDGRSRHAGRDRRRLAGEARQPDLCRQLQPAAPGRAGARQQAHHRRARRRLPRRGLETSSRSIWGGDWDKLFERDHTGLLLKRMEECVDGDYQAFKAKGGAYIRKEFFGKYPELLELVSDMTDEQLENLHRGGHDPVKIYNAYRGPLSTRFADRDPGENGQGLWDGRQPGTQRFAPGKEAHRRWPCAFVKRFNIPVPEELAKQGKPYRPAQDSPEIVYMQERRRRWAAICRPRGARAGLQGSPARLVRRVDGWLEGARSLDHDGLRQHPAPSAEGSGDRQADRAYRAR